MNERKRARPADYFADWKEREALAEGMIPMVGTMSRENNVKCYIYGHSLVNRSVLQIMKDHRYVRQVEASKLSEFENFPVMKAISELNLGPAHIDVGKNRFESALDVFHGREATAAEVVDIMGQGLGLHGSCDAVGKVFHIDEVDAGIRVELNLLTCHGGPHCFLYGDPRTSHHRVIAVHPGKAQQGEFKRFFRLKSLEYVLACQL